MAFAEPRVGISVVLVGSSTNKVLVGKRIGSHGAGTFALPGGHLELGEGMEACGIRELEEETGIRVESMQFLGVVNGTMEKDKRHYVTVVYRADAPADAEAVVAEPTKCSGWQWVEWRDADVPSPRFEPLQQMLDAGFSLSPPSVSQCADVRVPLAGRPEGVWPK